MMNQHVNAQIEKTGSVTPAPSSISKPRAHVMRKPWLVGGAALFLFAAGAFVWWLISAGDTPAYSTVPVTRGNVTRAVTATGTVNPVLTILVGTYVSGVIQEIHCDFNTQVTRGQVCARIDPRPYQTVVDQGRANLMMARAQLQKDNADLAYAKLNYERMSRLAQSKATSQDAADNARNTYEQALAQIAVDEAMIGQREAQLASAEVNLSYTEIVSPVDGTVVSRNVTIGQTVAASFQTPTLFLIATDLMNMQVDTNISESDIGGIRDGNQAAFTVDAFSNRTFEGSVRQVRQSPQTVQNVVTYDVVVGTANRDLALKPGMTASARIIIDQRNDVIRVPSQSLRYSPGGLRGAAGRRSSGGKANEQQLWVLRNGKPVAVPVTIGLDDDNFVEIVKGELTAGDQVIVAEQRAANRSALPRPKL